MLKPIVYVLACGAEFLSVPGDKLRFVVSDSRTLDTSGSEPVYLVKVWRLNIWA